MKDGAYATHQPTLDRAKEAALVHCYSADVGEAVEVISPEGAVVLGPIVIVKDGQPR